ncbi:SDR family oxidoreductase [Mucilaginibacter ginsenosidivorax]|uniref:SDR family oxidoreductase n=1 Tax=Mucilaginibacter ginsenosidivorax TaxID=862126 RepID=A0A5B8W3C7_9SPHI|nr:SDR family oxidoreductase [Mucilaginibacter ginsenosidivorax]QEC77505.1 SDR family oxidoreductase [Mucilaginibacter ginsenosidivorax]
MSGKLKNKVAVVTGGNSGIGFATAKLFANEGAKVAVTGRDQATIATSVAQIGNNAIGFVADVANINSIAPVYEKVSSTFGKIDILVVNAGIVYLSPIADVTEEMFDQVSDINYKGVFFTVQKALPYLNDGASIVITSSTVANKGIAGGSVYLSTKAAERALVRAFAAELVGRNIRVNALSPGSVGTPIFKKAGFAQEQEDAMNQFFATATPMKRAGSVDEMAKGFLFLASDDSSYMTGGDLLLDGGFRDL